MEERALPIRFLAYTQERFPLVPYSLLVAVFFASGALVAGALGGGTGRIHVATPFVLLLFFFHLRVFDEHKDYAIDREAHPERLLSRGVITLRQLSVAGTIAVAIELGLVIWIGWRALLAWSAALTFSVLMRYEFFVGPWLRRHLVAYALTHNPVAGLLAFFVWATADVPWSRWYLLYVGLVSFGTLGFEVGRKIKQPEEEIEGADTYSQALGRHGAFTFLFLAYGAGMICLALLSLALSDALLLRIASAVPALAAVLLCLPLARVASKRVELSASLYLLLSFVLAGGLALL